MAPIFDSQPSEQPNEEDSCIQISVNDIVFSRTTLIIVLTLCVAITGISMIAVAALGYRQWSRHHQDKQEKDSNDNARYLQRIPMIRKEVDSSCSRKCSGCLVNEPENPFLVPRSPVELMASERPWEVPAATANERAKSEHRDERTPGYLYDDSKGQWFHRP